MVFSGWLAHIKMLVHFHCHTGSKAHSLKLLIERRLLSGQLLSCKHKCYAVIKKKKNRKIFLSLSYKYTLLCFLPSHVPEQAAEASS